jgi:uncharacterized LabA/DUF88 family protein
MDRVAIFVDAGYLFAQGSACLLGQKQPRNSIVLDAAVAIQELKEIAKAKTPGCSLLRVYWYDGAIFGSKPTTDQVTLANLDDVKLRLGFINSHGQQKGVDSLIVTDLIELARLKSISDAILVSGDEDVRVGVLIAQNHGVRVHLVGIHPARGSQSPQLMQESDTTIELHKETMGKFLSKRADTPMPATEAGFGDDAAAAAMIDTAADKAIIERTVSEFVQSLDQSELLGVETFWKTERGVPADLDKKLLPKSGQSIGRKLQKDEIRYMRSHFQVKAKARIVKSD